MGTGGGRGSSERAEGREFSFLGTASRLTPDPAGDFDKSFTSKAPSVDCRKTCKSPIIFRELRRLESVRRAPRP